MPPHQPKKDQTNNQANEEEKSQRTSGDRKGANSVAICGWLNEKPNEGHWTALAKLTGLGDGNGLLESKI